MISSSDLKFAWRLFFIAAACVGIGALHETFTSGELLGVNLWRSRWTFLLFAEIGSILLSLTLIIASFNSKWWELQANKLNLSQSATSKNQILGIITFLMASILFFTLYRVLAQWMSNMYFPVLFIFTWLVIALSFGISFLTGKNFAISFILTLILSAVSLRLFALASSISDYPFSMGWSEASRYYYASLLFSKSVYGQSIPLSIWHPSRYFLQSIPFAFGEIPLWTHRAWQVVLWVSITTITAVTLVGRLKLKSILLKAAFIGWIFIFLFQGAVYYHLQISVIIILIGISKDHPFRSLLAVILASFWAGMSRLNWFPVPALLATTLYFLETPIEQRQTWFKYLLKPVLWFVTGNITALIAQSSYVVWSGNGNNLLSFGSSFASDLLWYRLLPNPTYPMGIILATALVTFPVFWIISIALKDKRTNWHALQYTGQGLILLALLFGGMLVSTKIGGGGDLHNMDAFLVVLCLIFVYLLYAKLQISNNNLHSTNIFSPILVAVIVPMMFSYSSAINSRFRFSEPEDKQSLAQLQQLIVKDVTQDHEILFIYQRHLITLNMLEIPLIPDYEVITLQEMAMSHNTQYLTNFYKDLDNHRFAYIISEPLFTGLKGKEQAFGEENDAWVMYVGKYLACEYTVEQDFKEQGFVVLIPNPENPPCPQ